MSRIAIVSLACAGALALSACSRPAPPDEPVRAVKLVQVEAAGHTGSAEYAAVIQARTESRLGFRVGGQLLQRPAEVGQAVKAGQLLALLDPRDYQAAAQAAAAQVAAARTQRDLAAADLRRFESLRAQGFISGAELERRQTGLNAAQAALDQAQAQATVQQNQAGYTRLLADADGVVVAVEAEPGQVLGAGSPVLRLARSGPRDAVLALPEDRLSAVRVGQPAEVRLWAQPGGAAAVWTGRVREVAASADPLTRTYAVKVALDAQPQPPLGATATVRLAPPAGSAAPAAGPVRLPTSALWQQGSGSAVWVFDAQAGVVRARAVQVAGVDGQQALIAQGLQGGEEVVAAGTHVLSEGQPVVRYGASR
ncbi:efflux RND transporter periplasmic adaptor subunit [Aquabacterium sp. A08]|uniref:efflux RND transporter periplasmic adaptor subunit n=1 Tax=Aquabacterium sp. A08 TaxID=2718532 RepID=UPI001423B3E8|nr:efflux RND transporter periplasmic adaptor subunit [Aquabacterium sp. A08]NIC40635.1 efflux RND transporter periplasmic adaptor subunit [Aquabacterium sp. A08]